MENAFLSQTELARRTGKCTRTVKAHLDRAGEMPDVVTPTGRLFRRDRAERLVAVIKAPVGPVRQWMAVPGSGSHPTL